ncbi:MAG: AI-2E family transporter [Phormidesmis sp.]
MSGLSGLGDRYLCGQVGHKQMKFGKLVGLVLFVLLLALLWQIRQVLLLAFCAIAFATVINKLVQKLQKLAVPRALAVAIALIGITGILSATVWFVAPPLVAQLPESTFFAEQGFEQLQTWYRHLRGMVPGAPLADTSLRELLPQIAQLGPDWFSRLLSVFTGSLDFFLNCLLVAVTIIMLLADPTAYRNMFLQAFPQFYRERAGEILDECETSLTGWFLGVLFNMTVITIFSAIGLSIIGVPLPVINALIAGALTFIPNIGPLVSVVPPFLMALAIAPWKAAAVVILYFAVQQIEGSLLTPFVMKKQVSLLPAVTLIAQLIFAVFFGLLGLFLALPLVIVLQVWLKELLVKDILNHWSSPRRSAYSARKLYLKNRKAPL